MESKSKESPFVLEINQLRVNYDKTPALRNISLSIPAGLLIGIIGPNGAGKSTLIKAALGLLKPLSGKVKFWNQPLQRVRQRVAYVPQRESVDWDFPVTVRDLVVMGCYGRLGLFHSPEKKDWVATDHYLHLMGMQDYAHRQISQLSGGQQQRVFLARALLQEADLYFMDEPLTGVDLATEIVMIQTLQELRKEGKTVFIVHHDLNTVESYFDWVILLNRDLIAYGPRTAYFTPDYLNATYGHNDALFNHAWPFSSQRQCVVKNKTAQSST